MQINFKVCLLLPHNVIYAVINLYSQFKCKGLMKQMGRDSCAVVTNCGSVEFYLIHFTEVKTHQILTSFYVRNNQFSFNIYIIHPVYTILFLSKF